MMTKEQIEKKAGHVVTDEKLKVQRAHDHVTIEGACTAGSIAIETADKRIGLVFTIDETADLIVKLTDALIIQRKAEERIKANEVIDLRLGYGMRDLLRLAFKQDCTVFREQANQYFSKTINQCTYNSIRAELEQKYDFSIETIHMVNELQTQFNNEITG